LGPDGVRGMTWGLGPGAGAGGRGGAKWYFHDPAKVFAGQALADSLAIAPLASNTTGPLTLGLAMARQSADTFCADAFHKRIQL
jgi:hypothetical protein